VDVSISTPAEPGTISVNDLFQFGGTGSLGSYSIIGFIDPDPMDATRTVLRLASLPGSPIVVPPVDSSWPFKVIRQPRKVESSRVELPPRVVIDFLASGYGRTENQFDPYTPIGGGPIDPNVFVTSPIIIWFDRSGSIERVLCERVAYDALGSPTHTIVPWVAVPDGFLYLLVTSLEVRDDGAVVTTVDDALADSESHWVAVNNRNATVNVVGNGDPGDAGLTLAERLFNTRSTVHNRNLEKQ
jgi:hypothetical protein